MSATRRRKKDSVAPKSPAIKKSLAKGKLKPNKPAGLSREEGGRLAKHDAEEKRIQQQPEAVLGEASAAIDRGATLLLKLIRSGKLTTTLYPTKKEDRAIERLCSQIGDLNRQLIRLAEINAPKGCWHLWFEAKALAESVVRLASIYPEEFREVAENSLTMPSLRAPNPKFTADAKAIGKAIHLAEKHPTPNLWDNDTRAGAHCHQIVTKLFEDIHHQRFLYQCEKENLERLKAFHETAKKYKRMTLEQSLETSHHPRLFAHIMACAALPDWKKDPSAWWEGRVLPMVKDEFARLAENPKRNPALWEELKRGGELVNTTENDMRRYMEKLCKNKFGQIVRDCP